MQPSGRSISEVTNQQQSRSSATDGCTRNANAKAGNQMWEESDTTKGIDNNPHNNHNSMGEKAHDNGPQLLQLRPKTKKWKLRARIQKPEQGGSSASTNSKRPSSEMLRPNSETKKKRLSSPSKHLSNQHQPSSSSTFCHLQLADAEQLAGDDGDTGGESILVGAGHQPRQQP